MCDGLQGVPSAEVLCGESGLLRAESFRCACFPWPRGFNCENGHKTSRISKGFRMLLGVLSGSCGGSTSRTWLPSWMCQRLKLEKTGISCLDAWKELHLPESRGAHEAPGARVLARNSELQHLGHGCRKVRPEVSREGSAGTKLQTLWSMWALFKERWTFLSHWGSRRQHLLWLPDSSASAGGRYASQPAHRHRLRRYQGQPDALWPVRT